MEEVDGLFRGLLRQRALVFVLAAGLLVGGVVAVVRLPSGIYPEVDFPRIVVVAHLGDTPPELMQASVVRPLEESLATVLGVRRIRSRIIRGSAEIALQFAEGADMWRALQLTEAALGNAREELPPGTEIETEKVTPADFPILSFNLVGGTSLVRREAADFLIRPAFSRVPGVGRVEVAGGDPREIEVALDPARLAALHLRPSEVARRVGDGIVRRAVGRLDEMRQTVTETASTPPTDAASLAATPVANGPNGPIALGEVASVFEGAPDRTLAVHGPEGDAVQISISRIVGASAPDVVQGIATVAASLRLPPGLRLVEVYNQGALIRESILGIRDAIVIGILLTVGVLAFFLRDPRAGFLAALSVPTTLVVTFLVMACFGQTLNLMSLGGMAVAIGLVIDDAIVVVEAIVRRLEEGASPVSAAHEGLTEILSPVIGTTVTTVVVFLPLAFLSGLVGSFFAALAVTLASAVLISMLFALFVLPILAARFLRPRRNGSLPDAMRPLEEDRTTGLPARESAASTEGESLSDGERLARMPARLARGGAVSVEREASSAGDLGSRGLPEDTGTPSTSGGMAGAGAPRRRRKRRDRLATRYALVLGRILHHRMLAFLVVVVALVLGGALVKKVPTGFLPEMDEGAFVLDYFLPAGTSLEATNAAALRIEKILGESREIKGWARRTGAELGPVTATQLNRGDIAVLLKPRRERREAEEVMDDVRRSVESNLPGVRVEFIQILEDVLSDLSGAPRPVEIKILGSDQSVLTRLAKEVEGRLDGTPHMLDYYAGVEDEAPVLSYTIAPDAAARGGLSPADVADDLATALGGTIVGSIPRLDGLVPVRVRFADATRFDPATLSSAPIALGGGVVPLSRLAPAVRERGASLLYRENLTPAALASCDVEGEDLGGLAREIGQRLSGLAIPAGYRVEIGGRVEGQSRAFAQILGILALGIFAVFAVLVAQFASARAALLVLLTIPPALVGAVIFLAATGVPLNVSSMMGFVLLVGLVVKNGILIVQNAIVKLSAGIPLRIALISAGRRRLRPILMTTLCTIFGLLPLAFSLGAGSELQRPLAIAVIGGLVFSTLATLLLLPALAMVLLPGAASEQSSRL